MGHLAPLTDRLALAYLVRSTYEEIRRSHPEDSRSRPGPQLYFDTDWIQA